jgi:sterol desaturase/sphingolipid hydroxylase (fatty acid hydroxylase superfamily)
MLPPDAVCAVAALFIVGMVWLRTRMHYRREGARERAPSLRRAPTRLTLTRAGWGYFVLLAAALAVGWFAAPLLARQLAGGVAVAPLLARVIWFLVVYYLFIPVHRALRMRAFSCSKRLSHAYKAGSEAGETRPRVAVKTPTCVSSCYEWSPRVGRLQRRAGEHPYCNYGSSFF